MTHNDYSSKLTKKTIIYIVTFYFNNLTFVRLSVYPLLLSLTERNYQLVVFISNTSEHEQI